MNTVAWSANEFLELCNNYAILKYQDEYTGEIRGDCTVAEIDALLSLVDTDGSGSIKYMEFARIMAMDDVAGFVLNKEKGKKPPLDKAVIR